MNYTQKGTKETCVYIAKIGGDILAGIDNPAILQKCIADLKVPSLDGRKGY